MIDSIADLATVALAGGVGALARVEWTAAAAGRWPGRPVGTRVVNLVGTTMLAVLLTSGGGATALRVLGTGFLGGFTTFSTWMLDADLAGRDAWKELAIQLLPALLIIFAVRQ